MRTGGPIGCTWANKCKYGKFSGCFNDNALSANEQLVMKLGPLPVVIPGINRMRLGYLRNMPKRQP
jgi:hypothetical protein